MPTPTFHGKARDAAEAVLQAFREPSRLPAALAPIFIRRRNAVPCAAWSWGNQLLVSLHGYSDARGFRQWQDVNRSVRAGEKAMYILAPVTRRVAGDNDDEPRFLTLGFRAQPVFGLEQTEGEPLSTGDADIDAWLAALPLRDVAVSWGIALDAFNGRPGGSHGTFRPGRIALGVRNLSTWCHELVHAADHRAGALQEFGQHWRSETVAELGGAVLLQLLGRGGDADLGGCWRYVSAYADAAGVHPFTACQRVLRRTCDAVALILDTAARLAEPRSA
jgi:hypothetical protein